MGDGHPCVFNLPDVKTLLDFPEVRASSLDQCMLGSVYKKAICFLGNLSVAELRCNRDWSWWCVPWLGESYQAPHPRLSRRQLAIPWETWTPSMLITVAGWRLLIWCCGVIPK